MKRNRSKSAINEQKASAAEARYKEDLRRWRLEKGTNEINALFDGTALPTLGAMPTYTPGSTEYAPRGPMQLSDFYAPAANTSVGGMLGNANRNSNMSMDVGDGGSGGGGGRSSPTSYAPVKQPAQQQPQTQAYDLNKLLQNGIINQAEYNQYNTGKNGRFNIGDQGFDSLLNGRLQAGQGGAQYNVQPSGAWQDDFFGNYKKSYNDYYQPQLADKFKTATDNLTFDLARSGILRSQAAVDSQTDLVRQKAENEASLKSQADQGVAALQQRINAAKQNAINQLYSTENPDIGANSALSQIRTIQGEQPSYSPLGDIFKTAAVGIGGYQQGQAARQYNNIITGGNRSAATTIR